MDFKSFTSALSIAKKYVRMVRKYNFWEWGVNDNECAIYIFLYLLFVPIK